MNYKINLAYVLLFAVIIAFAATLIASDDNIIMSERIVAVVGNEPILKSEVEMTLMLENQNTLPEGKEYDRLFRKRLEAIVEEKILYQSAILDSIIVTDEYLNSVFDEQWTQITAQFPNDEMLRQTLAEEGFTLQEFKMMRRDMLKETLTKQMLIREKFGNIEVSPQYVDSFYREFKDSLPMRPPTVRLSVLVMNKTMDQGQFDIIDDIAKSILSELDETSNFEEVAGKYAEENPSLQIFGGDLGTLNFNDLNSELAETARNLEDGAISEPVLSPRGLHIIKRIEGSNVQVTLQHITITPKTENDNTQFEEYVNTIYDRLIASPDSFNTFIELYSTDEDSKSRNGDIGYFQVDQLEQGMKSRIAGNEKGAILKPIIEGDEADIFLLTDLLLEDKMNLEDDYDIVLEIAKQHKMQALLKEYVARVRENVYTDIRVDD